MSDVPPCCFCVTCICRDGERGTPKRRQALHIIIPVIISAMRNRAQLQASILQSASAHRDGHRQQQFNMGASRHPLAGLMYQLSLKVASCAMQSWQCSSLNVVALIFISFRACVRWTDGAAGGGAQGCVGGTHQPSVRGRGHAGHRAAHSCGDDVGRWDEGVPRDQ